MKMLFRAPQVLAAFLCAAPAFAQAPASTSAAVAPEKWSIDGGDLLSIIARDGAVYTWGHGYGGALGDGEAGDRDKPKLLSSQKDIRSVASGRGFCVAARGDGTVAVWGLAHGSWEGGALPQQATPIVLRALSNVSAVAAGESFAVMLRRDGSAWAWGSNNAGQLGDGGASDRGTPAPIKNPGSLKAVACGAQHALGLRANGTVAAWGKNGDGQLGDGTLENRNTPVEVPGLNNVRAVAAGWNWSLALKNDGSVWGWGSAVTNVIPSEEGESPLVAEPRRLTGLEGITAIAAGNWHALALKNDGAVLAWGNNGTGQLGDGGNGSRLEPRPVKDLSNITAIACGSWHSLALKSDGSLWAWGNNSTSQLGDGSKETRSAPVAVAF